MNTDVTPAYLLRAYAWAVLKANTTLTEADYGGLTPIVPLAEEAKLSDFDKPIIVYGYALDSTGELYARNSGSMTFAIYDEDFRRLTKVLNILQAAFERQDETARDINYFTSSDDRKVNGVNPFIGMRFGTVAIGFIEGGTPEDTEGGRQSALINITFDYFVDYDINTLSPVD